MYVFLAEGRVVCVYVCSYVWHFFYLCVLACLYVCMPVCLPAGMYVYVCMCACVPACVLACLRARVRACLRERVPACAMRIGVSAAGAPHDRLGRHGLQPAAQQRRAQRLRRPPALRPGRRRLSPRVAYGRLGPLPGACTIT